MDGMDSVRKVRRCGQEICRVLRGLLNMRKALLVRILCPSSSLRKYKEAPRVLPYWFSPKAD